MVQKIKSSNLDADVLTGNTELAEAANNSDTVLVHDTSAGALKKIQVSNLTAQAGDGLSKSSSTLAVDISGTTELSTGAATGDFVLIYDTSASALRKISQTNLLNFPTISSVSPTNAVSGDGTGNYTFVITGTGFTGASANLINSSGSSVAFDTVTVDSDTQITGVIAKSSLPGSGEPYDVKVTAGSGLASTLENQINIDQQPAYSTAAGSLGTFADSGRTGISVSAVAADPESGGDVTYTLESGSLPAGLSGTSTSSGYVISGNATAVSSNTTSNFTIRAADVNSNTSDRAFSITIQAPQSSSFTSSGTFSVPTGTSTVDVLVVAGGGGGGGGSQAGGGGGAGGLIYRPAFPVTPGGTITVTVGCGGAKGEATGPTPSTKGGTGSDSAFGTLTAKGGGGGGIHPEAQASTRDGNPGGSGGGAGARNNGSGGSAIQPTQPGESGNYGFGFAGGGSKPESTPSNDGGGGGGGAGAVGGNAQNDPGRAGDGGVGKAYTIADGTTSVYYAGGGGGGIDYCGPGARNGGGGGGQGGGGNGGYNPDTAAQAGTANRGGGGGGSGNNNTPGQEPSAAGGKGIVIVRY